MTVINQLLLISFLITTVVLKGSYQAPVVNCNDLPSKDGKCNSTNKNPTQQPSPSPSITQVKNTTSNNSTANSKDWKSCSQVASSGASSGMYNIFFGPFTRTSAYCQIDNQTSGWTVILRRSMQGSLLFNRSWEQYEFGFGTLVDEFWYGLDKISFLTSRGTWELHVELTTSKNKTLFAKYSKFRIHGPDKNYTISISQHSGVSDFLFQYNERQFTTYDRKNNGGGHWNCAAVLKGGWWFTESCYEDKSLMLSESFGSKGIKWTVSSDEVHYVTKIVMKIRQRNLLHESISASNNKR